MPRKKPTPKPFFAVKADFVESVDRFAQASLNLYHACLTAVNLEQINNGPAADVLKQRMAEWRAATIHEEPPPE